MGVHEKATQQGWLAWLRTRSHTRTAAMEPSSAWEGEKQAP